MSDDPDVRRLAPIVIFLAVLALLIWGRALYEIGN